MKKSNLIMSICVILFIGSCSSLKKTEITQNPLLTEFKTPFGVPPFNLIKIGDYVPAIRIAMKEQMDYVLKIAENKDEPTFENTIVALELSGETLDKVSNVFDNLNSSLTNDEMQKIAKILAPELSAHYDAINLNSALFKKIKSVFDSKNQFSLNTEDKKLLENTYNSFVRGGANLSSSEKEKLKKLNSELSVLSLSFGQNVLADINSYKLIIDNISGLAGLPENVKSAAAETAKLAGENGKWVFTLQKPSLLPFLTYSDNRELREKLFKAYSNLGNNENAYNNNEIIKRIVAMRAERASILGYKSHAAYVLDDNMAKSSDKVFGLLDKLWIPALDRAKREVIELQKMIKQEGYDFKLQAWDWWYYAEKVRKQEYAIDQEMLSEYFVLDNVVNGAFEVAEKLYGLKFEKREDIPVYHPDVRAYEVKESDGTYVGILYMDFFPRPSKRAGAWMSNFRNQQIKDETNIRPVITTNFNFTKPTAGKPALLTIDEVRTTFHEFGHALHGLLSQCKYRSLSGTSVSRDFVELPSQIMENWAMQREVLQSYARHYKSGEIIPNWIIEKLEASSHFNQGFTTTEYLAASLLDMNYHSLTTANSNINVPDFESSVTEKLGLIPEIIYRYKSTYFSHIFSGGYSAGYYGYIWAEVLDADAFEAFKEKGNIFDAETAMKFRKNILEKGGTVDAMELYRAFRGKEASLEPLLRKRGLKD